MIVRVAVALLLGACNVSIGQMISDSGKNDIAVAVHSTQRPLQVLVVVGYTDNTRNDKRNKEISKARAQVVKAYLITLGVDPSRIFADGKGSEDPLAGNESSSNKTQNNRVELDFVWQGPQVRHLVVQMK